ncbi:MAG TPA: arginase [Chloroflexota bacterium]|nr:arginase [Chloroflexota bacterium]
MTPVLNHTHTSETHAAAPAGPTVAIIGAPSGLGAPTPGQEAGPAALRAAGLAARLHAAHTLVVDWGDVVVPGPDPIAVPTARNQDALAALAGAVAARVGAALDDGFLPLLLGGDHSVSLGAIRAAAARMPIGVLWFDAHGDFNTPETSPSGNVHGMVLALLAGLGPAPLLDASEPLPGRRMAVLGARALDPGERKNLLQAGVGVYSAEALRALGPAAAVERAIAGLVAAGAERLYVSIDLDVLDPSIAPGVATRASSGLTLDEARAALQAVAHSGRVAALDVTELFPARDRDGATARAALSLVKAALSQPPLEALDWRRTQAGLRSSA